MRYPNLKRELERFEDDVLSSARMVLMIILACLICLLTLFVFEAVISHPKESRKAHSAFPPPPR
jgi:hypothetical protein